MSELSRITGVAGGTIFHHFKNKEDLFLNILEDVEKNIISRFDHYKKNMDSESGLGQIENTITFYLNLTDDLSDQFLLLHRHYPYQMAETNTRCRDSLVSVYDELLNIFEEGITRGISDGTVKTSSPRNMAMIIFALVDGVARLNTYHLYNAGPLYQDLMTSCRNILTNGVNA